MLAAFIHALRGGIFSGGPGVNYWVACGKRLGTRMEE